MTEHAPMPDEFRTMAACEALGTMLPVFERYGSLVTLVMKELLRSVYEVTPEITEQLTVEGNGLYVSRWGKTKFGESGVQDQGEAIDNGAFPRKMLMSCEKNVIVLSLPSSLVRTSSSLALSFQHTGVSRGHTAGFVSPRYPPDHPFAYSPSIYSEKGLGIPFPLLRNEVERRKGKIPPKKIDVTRYV